MMKLRMIPARKAIAPSTRQMFIITLFPRNAREDIRMTIPNIMTPTQIQALKGKSLTSVAPKDIHLRQKAFRSFGRLYS